MNSEQPARAPEGGPRFLTQFRLAASFLTILPLTPADANDAEVGRSLRWFPLIGFVIGAVLALEAYLIPGVPTPELQAVLVILSLVILTGGVHVDALADTADALGAGGDRSRALEILRDSRIGSFGACAIFLSLALKILALAAIAGRARYAALFAAPGISRWAMVAVPAGMQYLRSEGAGTELLQDSPRNLQIATITGALGLLLVISGRSIASAVVAVLIVLAARALYRRWVGGITGDLIGACGEVVETAVLIIFAII